MDLDSLFAGVCEQEGFDDIILTSSEGMVIAGARSGSDDQATAAAFCALFEDAFERASSDLGFQALDELTVLDKDRRRYVIRPLPEGDYFLVVRLAPRQRWRRATNQLIRKLKTALSED